MTFSLDVYFNLFNLKAHHFCLFFHKSYVHTQIASVDPLQL